MRIIALLTTMIAAQPSLAQLPVNQSPPTSKPKIVSVPQSWSALEKDLISRFTFDRPQEQGWLDLMNVPMRDGVIELKQPPRIRQHAFLRCPTLDYQEFTVAVRLRPDQLGGTLFVGGTRRFFHVTNLAKSGALEFHLLGLANSRTVRLSEAFPRTRLQPGHPITLAVSYSTANRRTALYLDGRLLKSIRLPAGFRIVSDPSDKLFTFSDLGGGPNFTGLVDELVLFQRELSANEVFTLKLGREDLERLK